MSKTEIEWDEEAKKRLEKAPIFIRPLAKSKVEAAVREMGLNRVTLELFEQIKGKVMGG